MILSARVRIGTLLLIPFLVLASFIFELSAAQYLLRETPLRWAADSLDYMDYYQAAGLDRQLVRVDQNLLGPLLLLYLVDGNAFSIFLLNVAFFVAAYFTIVRNLHVNSAVLAACIWVNPMILVSLLAVNKEIVAFLATALYAAYLVSEKRSYLLLALVAALFVRWQHVLVIVFFEVLRSPINPFRRHRLLTLLGIVALFSVAYPFFDSSLGGVITEEVRQRQAESSFGLVEVANNIQRSFGYFLVVVPKILANWFGNLPRVGKLFVDIDSFDLDDLYNTFVIPSHQVAMVLVVLLLIARRRFSLRSDLVYFGLVYSVLYSLSMFIQYRYFFPVYLLFAIELARRNKPHEPEVLARSGDHGSPIGPSLESQENIAAAPRTDSAATPTHV